MDWMKPFGLAALLALGSVAHAQDTDIAEEAPDPLALSMGEEADVAEGEVYLAETFDDWEIRCIKTDEVANPCQMYQLLFDADGNSVAEVNIFTVGAEDLAAGATVVTPLMTLLTEAITFQVDDSTPRRYPFSWCEERGCISRIGFRPEEVEQLKAGGEARMSIVPVVAPDQRAVVTMSLIGFTAAYDSLVARDEAGEGN